MLFFDNHVLSVALEEEDHSVSGSIVRLFPKGRTKRVVE